MKRYQAMILCTLLGAGTMALADNAIFTEQAEQHKLTVKMEADIAYQAGVEDALLSVTVGACYPRDDFDDCRDHFDKLIRRMHQTGEAFYKENPDA